VASAAKRDQIVLGIFAPMAPEPDVVDLNCAHESAELTTPTIPLQNLFAQSCIFLLLQPYAPAP
jgi:hypothetical protein